MPLDTGVAGILDLINSRGVPSLSAGTPEQARQMFDALTIGTRRPEFTPPVGSVEDLTDGPVPIRLYRPEGEPGSTGIAYFHGGGFVIGSIETHDLQARALCRATGMVVASADYRLAPEDPWPAGAEDAIAVTNWALERFDRVAVAGDSAGGTWRQWRRRRCATAWSHSCSCIRSSTCRTTRAIAFRRVSRTRRATS